jgi:hypothetical protein
VLAPGDEIRLGGQTYQVVALDGSSARLAGVTGAAAVMLIGHLLADPSFELVTAHRRLPPAVSGLEHLPDEVRASAEWWERHIVEVLTGVPPDALPGTAPQPEYDPRRRSLRQRELAKHAALTAAGHEVALSTLQRLRRRYELEGIWGLVDRRYAFARPGRRAGRPGRPAGGGGDPAGDQRADRPLDRHRRPAAPPGRTAPGRSHRDWRPASDAAGAHLLPAGRAPVGRQAHLRLGAHPPVAGQAA